MSRFRLFSFLILGLGLIWIAINADLNYRSTSGQIPAPRQGFLAPDFTLKTVQGEVVSLRELRGQVVVLNFWASWCLPCRAEMPILQRIAEEYASQGVVVLGVNSTAQDIPGDVTAFLERHGITFPIVLDLEGKVTRLYEIHSFPTTFFVGPDGVIRAVTIGGPISEVALRAQIEASR